MKLEGIHHVTAITGDAPGNVDFYAGVLGLRLVKKTVNQDDPTVYHLFYADERGSAGSDITFFEYPGSPRGRAGAGMVHRVAFRVASERVARLLAGARRRGAQRRLARLRGSRRASRSSSSSTTAARSRSSRDTRRSRRSTRCAGLPVCARMRSIPEQSRGFLEGTLGFEPGFVARGEQRSGFYEYDVTEQRGRQGAGTVHHVAWASPQEEHEAWRAAVEQAGARPTPIIDRFYFKSIYFREPSGVLFEIATLGPGFAVDEPRGAPRRAAVAAARVRAPARAGRAAADAAAEPARRARLLTIRRLARAPRARRARAVPTSSGPRRTRCRRGCARRSRRGPRRR